MNERFEASVIPTEGRADQADSFLGLSREAIVLHVRPYRETSSLIDLFTEDQGRLRLLAKGVRRSKQSQAELLPFTRIRYAVGGRGELRLLTRYEAISGWSRLEGDALYCGFYVAELLIRLLPLEDAHPGLYGDTLSVLQRLAHGARPDFSLRCFERGLLEELGYGLNLHEDVEGLPIVADEVYRYHPEQGAERLAAGQEGIPGSALMALESGRFDDERDLMWAKRLMRSMLEVHLEGRPLKSRELFQIFSKRKV